MMFKELSHRPLIQDGGGSDGPSGDARGKTVIGQSDGNESMSLVGAMKKLMENEVRKLHTFDLGLVTSIFPHADGGDNENYYCSVRLRDSDADELRNVPIMTPHIGFAHVPNIGDLVVIGYIGGNVNSPVVLGSLYNDEQRPPRNRAGESIYVSPDDKDSKLKRLYFRCPSGTSVLVKDDMVRVNIGKTVMTMRSNGEVIIDQDNDVSGIRLDSDGTMWIKSGKSLAITANSGAMSGDGSINISTDKDVKIDSQNGKVSIETFAGEVSIDAKTELKLKAPKITMEGTTVTINGSAVTEVKGGMVKIN